MSSYASLAFGEMKTQKHPGAVIWSCHKPKVPKNRAAWGVAPAPGLINPSPAMFKSPLPPTTSTVWNY